MDEWAQDFDVAVIGSGGPGLVAALRACDRGARVVVIEKSRLVGGTTAMSGGVLWVPGNHHMADLGSEDSPEEALTYLRRVAYGQSTETLLQAFVGAAPGMVRYLEMRTPLRFAAVRRPDYHPEWEGGKLAGRSLDIEPFDATQLEPRRAILRTSPHYPPITYRERYAWGRPDRFDWPLIAERIARGIVTMGAALVAALLKSCLDSGVQVVTEMRARELIRRAGRVVGVQASDAAGRSVAFGAARAVVVASGGFEWNRPMERHFLRGPELAPATSPWNTGDGIIMGAAIGPASAT